MAFVYANANPTAPFFVDIHIPVVGTEEVTRANSFLNDQLGNHNIDFSAEDTPHITLYLTSWNCHQARAQTSTPPPPPTCLEYIQLAIASVKPKLSALGPCEIQLSAPYAIGSYAMLNVTNTPCLQRYSDLIVNTTFLFAAPNQTVPSWVYSLPEPERSEKIHYVQQYGSPNVFTQFQPHVTLGWDSNASHVQAAVTALNVSGLLPPTMGFAGEVVAMGSVGDYGTVLLGKDLGIYNVSTAAGSGCGSHQDELACDSDNVTDGGCVYCRAHSYSSSFCTSDYNARKLPSAGGDISICNWHR